MTRKYDPATHDSIIIDLNRNWRLTDSEIGERIGFDSQTIYRQRIRLNLPMNRKPMPVYAPQVESRAPKERQNPMKVAHIWLGKRLVEKRSGYFLDGCPVNLTSIMKATNSALKAAGAEQLDGNPGWLV